LREVEVYLLLEQADGLVIMSGDDFQLVTGVKTEGLVFQAGADPAKLFGQPFGYGRQFRRF
jgi:hypothetical protein